MRIESYLEALPALRAELATLAFQYRLRLSCGLLAFALWAAACARALLPDWPEQRDAALILALLGAAVLWRSLHMALAGWPRHRQTLTQQLYGSDLAARVSAGLLEDDPIFSHAPPISRQLLYDRGAEQPLVQLRRLLVYLGWYLQAPARLLGPLALAHSLATKNSLYLLWLFPVLLLAVGGGRPLDAVLLYCLALPGLWLVHLCIMSAASMRYVAMAAAVLGAYLEQQWGAGKSSAPQRKRSRVSP